MAASSRPRRTRKQPPAHGRPRPGEGPRQVLRAASRTQRALVAQMQRMVTAQRSMVDLAAWALREVPFALAVVEDGRIAFANPRWRQLEKATVGARPWRRVDDDGPETLVGGRQESSALADIVFSCAREAIESASATEGIRLYERQGHGQGDARPLEINWSISRDARRVVVTGRLVREETVARRAAAAEAKGPAVWFAHQIRNDVSTVALVLSSLKVGGGPPPERLMQLLERAVKSLAASSQALEAVLRQPSRQTSRQTSRQSSIEGQPRSGGSSVDGRVS